MQEIILSARNVVKNYAGHRALDKVSLDIPRGTVYGLLGPNGAGKTSLIRIITQITGADEGEVWFNGNLLHKDHIQQMGYMPEERGLYKKMKVGEQLLYLAQLKGLPRAEAVTRIKAWLQRLDIAEWWNKPVEDLSKGMAQKIQFIATVVHRPELIILDEPFSGFDPVNANIVKEEILKLKSEGSTIIFSTHRMESVEEMCDYIALINKSHKILDGTTQGIRNEHKTNTWQVTYTGTLSTLPENFGVQQVKTLATGQQRAFIKLAQGNTPNELLAALLGQVSITHFEEVIPSINDIFISRVTGNN